MIHKICGFLSLLSLLPFQILASPFGEFDARSGGMGSVGVATSTLGSAAFYNPAMLSHQEEDSDFELFIVGGLRGSDADKLLDDIDDYDLALSALDPVEAQRIFEQSLGKNIALSTNAGASFGINARAIKMAIIAQRNIHGALKTGGTDITDASINGIGVDITEIGLAISFDIGDFAIGVTPKAQEVTSFDYTSALVTADTDFADIFDELGEIDHGRNFNLDLGILYKISDSIFAGVTARNLSSETYTTANGTSIDLERQIRAGVGYHTNFLRLGFDVDITENEPIAFESKTRYAAIGVELNAWDWLQFRLGYRDNIASGAEKEQLFTAGIGIRLFGSVGLDIAAQANETEDADQIGVLATLVASF